MRILSSAPYSFRVLCRTVLINCAALSFFGSLVFFGRGMGWLPFRVIHDTLSPAETQPPNGSPALSAVGPSDCTYTPDLSMNTTGSTVPNVLTENIQSRVLIH